MRYRGFDVKMRDIYDLPVRYKVLMQRAVLDVKMRGSERLVLEYLA